MSSEEIIECIRIIGTVLIFIVLILFLFGEDRRAQLHAAEQMKVFDLWWSCRDLLHSLDEYPEQLVPINRESAMIREMRRCMEAAEPIATAHMVRQEKTNG